MGAVAGFVPEMTAPRGSVADDAPGSRGAAAPSGVALFVVVALLAPVGLIALLPGPRPLWEQARGAADPSTAVGAAVLLLCAAAAWGVLCWAAAVLVASAATRLPGWCGRRAAAAIRVLAPRAVRHLLIAGTGLTLAVGASACATTAAADPPVTGAGMAAPSTAHRTAAATAIGAGPVAGTIVMDVTELDLDWPTEPAPAADPTTPVSHPTSDGNPEAAANPAPTHADAGAPDPAGPDPSPAAVDHGIDAITPDPAPDPLPQPGAVPVTVTVQAGDSLWAIVAAHLGPTATAGDILAGVDSWYEINRDVIGVDPDLILPGQVLTAPDSLVRTGRWGVRA